MPAGTSRVAREGGGTLTPSPELGLRPDGGDAETGAGLELRGGIGYADPNSGRSTNLHTHGLVVQPEGGCREWDLSGSVRLAPDARGRGASFSLAPAWGVDPGGGRRDAEPGYALPAFGGGFTVRPYLGSGCSDTKRKYRLGGRLTRPAEPGSRFGAGAGAFAFSRGASRRETAHDNPPEHAIGFRASAGRAWRGSASAAGEIEAYETRVHV